MLRVVAIQIIFYPQVLVGQEVPDFTVAAVLAEIVDNFNFKEATKGKYAVVFSSIRFYFVCPSELIAFDHRLAESKNVEVIVFLLTHTLLMQHGAIHQLIKVVLVKLVYPLVADIKTKFAKVLVLEAAGGVVSWFILIDKNGSSPYGC